MNPTHFRRIIGGTGVVLGLCWIGYLAIILWHVVRNGMVDAAFDFSFTWILMFLVLIPGTIATICGVSLYRAMSAEPLRWITGIFIVTVLVNFASRIGPALPDLLLDRIQSNLVLLLCTLVSLPLYSVILRFLYRRLAVSGPEYSAMVNRGALWVVAIQVWLLLSGFS